MSANINSKEFRYLAYFMLIYFAFFMAMDLIRLWGFGYHVVDFGNFHQQIWNAANGDWFDTSIVAPFDENGSRLGIHFSVLVNVVSAPIYYIFSSPETLIFMHVFACTIAAVPVYRAVSAIGASHRESAFWAFIFLINPMSLYHAMFSLQDVSFAVPIIAFAMWAVLAKRFSWLLVCCALLVLAKEHYGVAVFGFGLLWAYRHKELKKGLPLAALGLVAFYVVVFVLMPLFSPTDSHVMLSDELLHEDFQRYQWMKLPMDELVNIVPQILFNQYNYSYLITILLPFLFLPVFAIPLILPVAGDIALSLLSTFLLQKMINFYYTAALAAIFAIASCYVCMWISKKSLRLKKAIILAILIINCYSAYEVLSYPITKYSALLVNGNMDWSYGDDFAELKRQIPSNAKLSAFGAEGSMLADRRFITDAAVGGLQASDMLVIRLNPLKANFAISKDLEDESSGASYKDYVRSLDEKFLNRLRIVKGLLEDEEWGVRYWSFPWIVFERGSEDKFSTEEITKEIPARIKQIQDSVN